MSDKLVPPSVAEFAIGSLADQVLKAQAEIKTWPDEMRRRNGLLNLPEPKDWLSPEHALQSLITENGEQIGMAATIAQQAELIRLQAAELAALKQAGVSVSDVVHHSFSRDRDIGWNASEEDQAVRSAFDEWLKTSRFTRPNSPWDIWKASARLNASRDVVPEGKYADVLAPFAAMMERELHANSGKGDRPGWLAMDRKTGLLEIYYHLGKLQKATKNNDEPGIVEYAADVANMSMMLVDICGLLAAAPTPAPDHSADDLKMVRVPRELANRLTSTDNHVRQTARRELRNMLLAGGAQ